LARYRGRSRVETFDAERRDAPTDKDEPFISSLEFMKQKDTDANKAGGRD
jgi:hypothetical protein